MKGLGAELSRLKRMYADMVLKNRAVKVLDARLYHSSADITIIRVY